MFNPMRPINVRPDRAQVVFAVVITLFLFMAAVVLISEIGSALGPIVTEVAPSTSFGGDVFMK